MERGEKCWKTDPSSRACAGGGLIVLNWKDGRTSPILKELVPVPNPACERKKAKHASSHELQSSEESKTSQESKTSDVPRKSIQPCTLKRRSLDNWLIQAPITYRQASADQESREVTAAVHSLLAAEVICLKELDKRLKYREFLALRKKELLYKRWLERVSLPILKTIEDHIDKQSIGAIEARRQAQLSLYLEFCNKKGIVSLEGYDPVEYNPLSLPDYFKVKTPPLHDPLLRPLRDRFEEEVIVLQCETGRIYTAKEIDELHKRRLPAVPVKRKHAKGIEWVKMPFGYIESEVRRRSRQRIRCHGNAGAPTFSIEDKRTPDSITTPNHHRKVSETSSLPSSAKPASAK